MLKKLLGLNKDQNRLSLEEQSQILDKLREEYRYLAKKYGKKVFDLQGLEDRLGGNIKHRIPLDGFLLAEIAALEKLKNKINEKLKLKENSVLKKIDELLASHMEKIVKYPDYHFHDKASVELRKLLGAVNQLFKNEFLWFEALVRLEKDLSLNSALKSFTEKFNFFVGEAGQRYAPRIEDHLLLLNRSAMDFSQVELDEKRFIKDLAILLNQFKDFLVQLVYEHKIKDPHSNLKVEFLSENLKKCLANRKKEDIIKHIIQTINTILANFRIKEFRSPQK